MIPIRIRWWFDELCCRYPRRSVRGRILRAISRSAYRLNETKWFFLHRFHPSHRYHVIKTGLRPGWRDRDDLLAHLLVDHILIGFVEDEKPFEHFETEGPDANHPNEWAKVRELYDYFKGRDLDEFDDSRHPERYEELTEKLVEIVRLRKMYWT